jgi:hypothetical protein
MTKPKTKTNKQTNKTKQQQYHLVGTVTISKKKQNRRNREGVQITTITHVCIAHAYMTHVYMTHIYMTHVYITHVYIVHVYITHVYMTHV